LVESNRRFQMGEIDSKPLSYLEELLKEEVP